MTRKVARKTEPRLALIHPDFEAIVNRIIQTVEKSKLTELRRDFHTRLRITLTQPDNSELVEDLWDFFYDWCIFDQKLLETLTLNAEERNLWGHVKEGCKRGLFIVKAHTGKGITLKDLYEGRQYSIVKKDPQDFMGMERGDIIEGRLMAQPEDEKRLTFHFVRRPSFHPIEIHSYIKNKIREFKKTKDLPTYHSWLWLLVGMHLKHRIYPHMPIDKIYDDNSRI